MKVYFPNIKKKKKKKKEKIIKFVYIKIKK